jgi:ABC-2 type transport system permease protein
MAAIIKREISAYFLSAIGYIVLAAFYIFGGFYFYMSVLMSNTTDLSYTFSSLFVIMIFVIPILTMRLFSEEKKQKTDQVLLTAPVSLTSIVLGKYFAALIMYLFCILITLVYAVIISFFNTPDWITVLGNFLGIFLLGAALIAIGMFLSSITENQIVAAIGGIVVGVLMLFMDSIAQAISVEFISNILKKISFMSYYNNFTLGVVSLKDIVFFLSVCVLFIFFTIRVFEKKRWS